MNRMPWPYDQQTPPWLYPAGTGAPANDEDGFDKYVRSFSQAPAEFATPTLPPPPEDPVPDIAWTPPESPVPDVAWSPLPAAQDSPAPMPPPPPAAEPAPAIAQADVPAELAPPVVPAKRSPALAPLADLRDKVAAPPEAVPSDGDRLSEGALQETGPDTADGFNKSVDALTNDPIATAEEDARLERLRVSESARMAAEANEQRVRDLDELAQRREAARAKAQADLADVNNAARAMSDQAPFQAYWSNAGTGQKIGAALLAVFGGLMQSSTGGRNSGIDFMMKLAEDDANAKWTKIRERRGLAQDALGNAEDDYKTGMALKLAGYEQLLRTIDAKAANLDPEGTARVKMAQARQEVIARMDAARAAAGQQLFKNTEEVLKRRQEDQKIIDARNKAQADIAAEKTRNAIAWKNAKTAADAQTETARHNKAMEEKEKAADAAIVRLERDALIRAQETAGPRIATVERFTNPDGTTGFRPKFVPFMNAPSEVVNPLTGAPVIDPATGKPAIAAQEWKAPSPAIAEKLNAQYAAVAEYTKLGHQMIDIITTEGWQSDIGLSKKYQEAKQAHAQAIITLKDLFGLGVIAGPDEALLNKAAGTSDPTQWRDTTAGIKKGIDNAILKFGEQMRGRGQYTGPDVSFAFEPEPVDPSMTESQRLVRTVAGTKGDPTPARPDEGTELARTPIKGATGPAKPIGAGQVPVEETTPAQATAAIGDLIDRATGRTFDPGEGGTAADSQKAALVGLREIVRQPQYRGEAMQAIIDAGIAFDGSTQPWLVDPGLERVRKAYAAAISEQLGGD